MIQTNDCANQEQSQTPVSATEAQPIGKRKLKDSGIAWIGEIPEHWEVLSMIHCLRANITDGPHETPELVDKGIPFISVDSLNESDSINFNCCKKYISEELYEEYNKKAHLEQGDILFSKAATIGKTAIVGEEKFMVWSPLAIIKNNPLKTNNKYLYYILNTNNFIVYTSLLGTNNTQINVGMRALEKAKIPCPSIIEQSRIASFLDKKCGEIDSLLSLQEEMISELKAYKQSLIAETVTRGLDKNAKLKDSGIAWIGEIPEHWEVFKIKQILRNKSIKNCPNEKVLSLYRDFGVIPKDSRDDNYNVTSEDTSSYKLVEEGDFVLNKMKAWQGSMAVSDYRGIISPAYYICTFKRNDLNKRYIHYLLRNESYKPEYLRLSTGLRVGQWDLNIDTFLNIPMIFPPLSEQRAIVTFLDEKTSQIDSLIAIKQEKIEALKDYKKSIIYEYVTGKKEVTP